MISLLSICFLLNLLFQYLSIQKSCSHSLINHFSKEYSISSLDGQADKLFKTLLNQSNIFDESRCSINLFTHTFHTIVVFWLYLFLIIQTSLIGYCQHKQVSKLSQSSI